MNAILTKVALSFLFALSFSLATAQEHGDEYSGEHDDKHSQTKDHHVTKGSLEDYEADETFTLRAEFADGKMLYVGEGGEIDGVQNPTLAVAQGETVAITLINASPLEHDLALPALEAHSEHVAAEGDETTFVFEASETGELDYYCTVPGHKEAGMLGIIAVDEAS